MAKYIELTRGGSWSDKGDNGRRVTGKPGARVGCSDRLAKALFNSGDARPSATPEPGPKEKAERRRGQRKAAATKKQADATEKANAAAEKAEADAAKGAGTNDLGD